jgi:hypothetical protein
MPWIADLSFDWPNLPGSVLTSLDADGVIGYAGCTDDRKNVSRDRFQDWLDSGLSVGLVIENGTTDLQGGASVGRAPGQALADAADKLGYDIEHCVLFASADWNARGTDVAAVVDAMDAFGEWVDYPGIYGNSYVIDACHDARVADSFWQSDSTSFSYGISPHAHLLQRYNDPRAQSLALDVNDILKPSIGLMGETTLADSLTKGTDDMVLWINADDNGRSAFWLSGGKAVTSKDNPSRQSFIDKGGIVVKAPGAEFSRIYAAFQ